MKKIYLFFLLNALFFYSLYGQSTQMVKGVVVDKNSRNPIPYATVALLNAVPVIGVTTDTLGYFFLPNVPVGRHDIEIRCIGYEPAILKEVLVGSSKEVVLDIHLQENLLELKEVTVKPTLNKTEPLNSMAIAGGRMLSVEEASRYAGGMDDPARLVSSFAGVTANVGNNGIVVRGNAPKFLQWRMEDVEIPNPNHFADVTSFGGGGLTALSSQVLGNSDFFTGAFPAEYNNALSGVFDMYLRNGNNTRYEHTALISFLGIEAASEGPFKKGYNGSYLFNYRYSTLSLLSPLQPEDADGTDYQDLSFKLFFPTRKAGNFSVWGIGLIDHSGTVAEKDKNKWQYEQDMENQDVKQYSGALGLNHKINIKKTAFLKTTMALTVSGLNMHTEQMNEQVLLVPKNVIKTTNWNFVLSSVLQRRYSEHHTNRTGIRITGLKYDLFMQDAQKRENELQTLINKTGFSSLFTAYSTSTFRFTNQWSMNAGINAQYFTLNGNYTIEPRVSLKYQFMPNHSFSLAYGMHSRLEMLNYYFMEKEGEKVNKDLDFTKAHHFSLGYDLNIGENKHLKIEPYMQFLYNIPIISDSTYSFVNLQGNDDWFLSEQLINAGKGINYGIDITFEKYMSHGYYYMLTASIFNSLYKTTKNKWYNTRYNRNFVLNFLAGKEWMLGKNHQYILGINSRVTFQGGDRYSPVNESASLKQQDAIYDESNPYSKQLSPVLLGHLTVSYKINKKRVSHEFAAKILNITGYKDYYGHRYNYVTHQVDEEREANIIPNISYKIEF
ncbi:TonB-dependent receptor [Bacteroides congonensis]|uniref:TonB-dependent receptor n=1 Tax=Bacteroides congonensis TaxID=1871006 RepID=UPI00265E8F6F|nr:TonB-dependent receptor [Bacteroides congonensis]